MLKDKIIQKEEREFLITFLDEYFLKPKYSPYLIDYKLAEKELEFIVRPDCNQKCDYCYLTNFGKDIYKISRRKGKDVLLNNLKAVLNTFEKNKIIIPTIQLYAGDLFYDKLIYPIFEIVYEYYYKIYKKEPAFFENMEKGKGTNEVRIVIPTNYSFVKGEGNILELRKWVEKFGEMNIKINLSCSADGKYATYVREKKNEKEVDEYYQSIMYAIAEFNGGIHPMISAESISTSIQNYDWWVDQLTNPENILYGRKDIQPMMLEVRNGQNSWNETTIGEYLKLLNHIFDFRFKLNGKDPAKMAYHLVKGDGQDGSAKGCDEYDPIFIYPMNSGPRRPNSLLTCGLGSSLQIYLADLSIVPCHRLAYEEFIGGKFIANEAELTDLIPLNTSGYAGIVMGNNVNQPRCNQCHLYDFCIRGCLGAQYEETGEVYCPIDSVCNFFDKKHEFLIKKYSETGILEALNQADYLSQHEKDSYNDLFKYYMEKKEKV